MAVPSPAFQLPLEERRELTRLYLRQGRQGYLSGAALGILTGILMWLQADVPLVWAWSGGLGAITLGILHIMKGHLPQISSLDLPALKRMENFHAALSASTGILWGMLPWVFSPGHGAELALDNVTTALAVGISTGAVAMMAPLPKAGAAFVIPALLPYALKLFLREDDIYTMAAFVVLGGIVTLMYLGQVFQHFIVENIRLRLENVALIAEVRSEKLAVEEASRIKSLFLAGVSHDLKHPLAAIGLYLGYLKTCRTDTGAAVGVARTLPGMEKALGSMGILLSRLLELSRLEAGEYQPRKELVYIESIFHHCAAQFREKARVKGLNLRFVSSRVAVVGDSALLQSILDNLVSNALLYTERGSVVVGVRHVSGHPVILVADNGQGIPEERIPFLFEAYRRFDDTQHSLEGYGLGLALVKKQCDLMGYTIKVKSVPGRGSLFSIHLNAS